MTSLYNKCNNSFSQHNYFFIHLQQILTHFNPSWSSLGKLNYQNLNCTKTDSATLPWDPSIFIKYVDTVKLIHLKPI